MPGLSKRLSVAMSAKHHAQASPFAGKDDGSVCLAVCALLGGGSVALSAALVAAESKHGTIDWQPVGYRWLSHCCPVVATT